MFLLVPTLHQVNWKGFIFFNCFFQYSEFITGSACSLANFKDNRELGFLAFLRLVGTAYFKKHQSSLISVHGLETPQQLFNSIDTILQTDKHKKWIEKIITVNDYVTSVDQCVPTVTALWRHWLRVTYICEMWENSYLTDVYHSLTLPECNGWLKANDGSYSIDWEDPEMQESINGNMQFLLKGCSYTKGCSPTSRCGCRGRGSFCGPSCRCLNCSNLYITQPPPEVSSETRCEPESDSSSDESCEELEEEIITDMDEGLLISYDIS